jgi:CheY-like chemotaxis protein
MTVLLEKKSFSLFIVRKNFNFWMCPLFVSAMVYTSPIKTLNFLKDHEQDVDFVLVALHMKEMYGFQFLDISREMQTNLQVISKSEVSQQH